MSNPNGIGENVNFINDVIATSQVAQALLCPKVMIPAGMLFTLSICFCFFFLNKRPVRTRAATTRRGLRRSGTSTTRLPLWIRSPSWRQQTNFTTNNEKPTLENLLESCLTITKWKGDNDREESDNTNMDYDIDEEDKEVPSSPVLCSDDSTCPVLMSSSSLPSWEIEEPPICGDNTTVHQFNMTRRAEGAENEIAKRHDLVAGKVEEDEGDRVDNEGQHDKHAERDDETNSISNETNARIREQAVIRNKSGESLNEETDGDCQTSNISDDENIRQRYVFVRLAEQKHHHLQNMKAGREEKGKQPQQEFCGSVDTSGNDNNYSDNDNNKLENDNGEVSDNDDSKTQKQSSNNGEEQRPRQQIEEEPLEETNGDPKDHVVYYIDDYCSICLKSFKRDEYVVHSNNHSCNHIFHKQCIISWLKRQNCCPLCRVPYVLPTVLKSDQDDDNLIDENIINNSNRNGNGNGNNSNTNSSDCNEHSSFDHNNYNSNTSINSVGVDEHEKHGNIDNCLDDGA